MTNWEFLEIPEIRLMNFVNVDYKRFLIFLKLRLKVLNKWKW